MTKTKKIYLGTDGFTWELWKESNYPILDPQTRKKDCLYCLKLELNRPIICHRCKEMDKLERYYIEVTEEEYSKLR